MLGEPRSEHLHVGAEVLQPIGMVDRGSGMERGHDGEVPRLVEASAQLGHAELGLQDELRGEVAQAHDHVGPDAADLLAQKRRAGLDLLGFGVAVAGWAALHHIGDVDVLAAQTRLGEQRVELLARCADERLALQVFVAPRALAHEHHARVRIAHTEDQVGARLPQRAQLAIAHAGADLLEGDLARTRLGMSRNQQRAHGTLLRTNRNPVK